MLNSFSHYKVIHRASLPGSPAERAGMKPGDIILAVNGKATPTFEDYYEATKDRCPLQKMRVLRAGQTVEVVLNLSHVVPKMIRFGKITAPKSKSIKLFS